MDIPRRDVDFDFDPEAVPIDWCDSGAYQTTFMAALSLLFPEGERFFVDSVKRVAGKLGRIDDPELQRAITGFIGQEAMHGKEHRAFNQLLVAHGHDEAPRVDAGLRRFLERVRQILPPMSRLAVTCALEHFTAMLAEQLLRDPRMQAEFHETVRPLWLWHALEESEHKAVAFDVYRAAGGGYARRVAMMLVTTIVFFAAQGLVHARLMATRKVLFKPWRWLRGIRHMWIWPGYFTRLAPAYLAYFRPGFHPDDRDTTALLARWRDALFGTNGQLAERTRVTNAA
ncbi:MAG: metal-dependent hydrolase [Kofleriaceae bacterium]